MTVAAGSNRVNDRTKIGPTTSLGIIRPDPGSLKFFSKPAKDADAEDRDVAEQVLQMQQSSLLEQPLTPLEKPELAFGYCYTSSGKSHEHIIHDWQVQEAYRQYKHRYAGKALDQLGGREYGERIPTRACTSSRAINIRAV